MGASDLYLHRTGAAGDSIDRPASHPCLSPLEVLGQERQGDVRLDCAFVVAELRHGRQYLGLVHCVSLDGMDTRRPEVDGRSPTS